MVHQGRVQPEAEPTKLLHMPQVDTCESIVEGARSSNLNPEEIDTFVAP